MPCSYLLEAGDSRVSELFVEEFAEGGLASQARHYTDAPVL